MITFLSLLLVLCVIAIGMMIAFVRNADWAYWCINKELMAMHEAGEVAILIEDDSVRLRALTALIKSYSVENTKKIHDGIVAVIEKEKKGKV